jgi:glycosyltransferase involved in cell wall biosynthesis
MRGGERVLHQLAQMHPGADLYTLFYVPGTTSPEIEKLRIHPSPLSSIPGMGRHYRKLLPAFPWAIRRFHLRDYDLVISCSHAVAKGVTTDPETPHLCYCLTPMRYIWDQADRYLGGGALRTLASPLIAGLRRFDRSSSQRVTRFAAISRAVAGRIRHCYARSSQVVHPPVDVSRIVPSGRDPEDFYLLVGAFVPYKCEALAIEAFRRLGRRLVVAGDGPMRARLEATAPSNVEFLGWVSDGELADLYARCRALVYPQEEDFGIIAVEAQAAGRPVLAFARGGALDTVLPLPHGGAPSWNAPTIDGHSSPHSSLRTPARPVATGIWFSPQVPEALVEAVLRFEKLEPLFDTQSICSWAQQFGPDRFRRELEREIELALAMEG